MTQIAFRDANGSPVRDATVAITAAPGDMADIGYVTDDNGSVVIAASAPGDYQFTLNLPDGSRLSAVAQLGGQGREEVVATPLD